VVVTLCGVDEFFWPCYRVRGLAFSGEVSKSEIVEVWIGVG
jgi:hypothetical protein